MFIFFVLIAGIFRYLLKIERIDGKDVYDSSSFTEASFMKLLAYSTKLVSILKEGLSNFSTPSYRQFSKKAGHIVTITLQYVTDHFNAYKKSLSDPPGKHPLGRRIQVEYDEFHMRSLICIFSSRNSGVWQYLVKIPYDSISPHMLWRILYVLCFNPTIKECEWRGKSSQMLVECTYMLPISRIKKPFCRHRSFEGCVENG